MLDFLQRRTIKRIKKHITGSSEDVISLTLVTAVMLHRRVLRPSDFPCHVSQVPCSDRKLIIKKQTYHWYVCFLTGNFLSSQAASSQVLSTFKGLTSVFEMRTGGSP